MMLYCKLSLSERENIATHFIFKSLRGSLRGKLKSIKDTLVVILNIFVYKKKLSYILILLITF